MIPVVPCIDCGSYTIHRAERLETTRHGREAVMVPLCLRCEEKAKKELKECPYGE